MKKERLNKNIVLCWEEVETPLYEIDGCTLIMINDLFNNHQWFEIKISNDENEHYIPLEMNLDVYGAIDEFNKFLDRIETEKENVE